MRKALLFLASVFLLPLLFVSCKSTDGESSESVESEISYEQISAKEAKEIMDTENEYVIIDSRTQDEFDKGHIKGAIMIPEYEIKSSQDKLPSDKNTLILVYCRSGRRSKIASSALVELGYTNVKEFGGIIDWPYEIVTE